MSEQIADGTVETPIDWEARALKAEAKIVADKKAATEITESKEVVEPKGLTAEDVAKMIAEANKENAIQSQEKTFETNQAQTNSMSISNENPVTTTPEFKKSIAEYDALSAAEQRTYYNESMEKFGTLALS